MPSKTNSQYDLTLILHPLEHPRNTKPADANVFGERRKKNHAKEGKQATLAILVRKSLQISIMFRATGANSIPTWVYDQHRRSE